jgi:hypothetical protein
MVSGCEPDYRMRRGRRTWKIGAVQAGEVLTPPPGPLSLRERGRPEREAGPCTVVVADAFSGCGR